MGIDDKQQDYMLKSTTIQFIEILEFFFLFEIKNVLGQTVLSPFVPVFALHFFIIKIVRPLLASLVFSLYSFINKYNNYAYKIGRLNQYRMYVIQLVNSLSLVYMKCTTMRNKVVFNLGRF